MSVTKVCPECGDDFQPLLSEQQICEGCQEILDEELDELEHDLEEDDVGFELDPEEDGLI